MTVAANAVAYADRVATTPVLALLLFWVAAGWPGMSATGALESGIRSEAGVNLRTIAKGAVWLVLAFAPTILLPVRSSLYGVLPSVGMALIVAEIGQRIVARVTPLKAQRAVVAMFLVFVALLPAYWARNERYVREAELSAAIVGELVDIASRHPTGGLVVIRDDRRERPTAEQAFGPLADRAALLATGGTLQVWIEPAPRELASVSPPDLRSAVATLVVEDGRLRQSQ
jgi:hypothetical protein